MNETQDCVLARTLAARLDLKKTTGFFEHIEQCSPCRQSYLRIREYLKDIDIKIPIIPLSLEEKKEITSYSLDLLNNLEDKRRRKKKKWALW